MEYFFGPYLHFCLELALKTWAKVFLIHSLGVHDLDHTHLLAAFNGQGSPISERSSWLKIASVPEIVSLLENVQHCGGEPEQVANMHI